MANENKKTKELVTAEDDPTAELEVLALKRSLADDGDAPPESLADTHNVEDGDNSGIPRDERSETINRLQYDIEQFRARWNGLEAEIKARQQITENLQGQISGLEHKLDRKDRLLRKRAASIKSLKAEIRERNEEYGSAQDRLAELEAKLRASASTADPDSRTEDRQLIAEQSGKLAAAAAQVRDLQDLLDRTETYADTLRRQLQDRDDGLDELQRSSAVLENNLHQAQARRGELEAELADSQAARKELQSTLDEIHSTHAEEIRMIRFELGEAQETVSQQELVAEQLASDLLDTRNYRAELEEMLSRSEVTSQSRIEQLETENRNLRGELEDRDRKLSMRSDAINSLLAELAGKSRQIESIVEIREVEDSADEVFSGRASDRPPAERDRTTRLLVGTLEGQELRFPLFKDRLTIGRTDQNDIQLKASYVSRRHAVVVTDRENTRVIDWGSKNGVFVNGTRVTEHFLKNGDTVTIGTADFRYEELSRRDS